MFEQSFVALKMQVKEKYGSDGVEILKEFRNKEILNVIESMSDDELALFYLKIEENLSKTETLSDSCIRNGFLKEEERFDYDSFYHNCYQKLAGLINKKDDSESKYVALQYKNIIENIRANIKSVDDIKKCFTTTYEVKDEIKLSSAEKIYNFKKCIEKYFRKLVKDYGYDKEVEVEITLDDILMLVNGILNGLDEDFLSKFSFVSNQDGLLSCLRSFEEEFKEILIKLAFDENNNFIILTKNYTRKELEIYLYVMEGLSKTQPVKEENLLDTIFKNEDTKNNPSLRINNSNATTMG